MCRQLGFASAIDAVLGGTRFGGGFGKIYLDEIECSGNEASLGACSSDGWYNHDCDHSEDAGVICDVGLLRKYVESMALLVEAGDFLLQSHVTLSLF